MAKAGLRQPTPKLSLLSLKSGFPSLALCPWAPWAPQTPLPWPSLTHCFPGLGGHCGGTSLTAQAREESWALAIFRAKIEAHGLFAQHLIRLQPSAGPLPSRPQAKAWTGGFWELTPCHRQEVSLSIFTTQGFGKQTTWPPASWGLSSVGRGREQESVISSFLL